MPSPASPQALPPGSEENRAPPYRAFLILVTVLTIIAITLRFWSRSMGPRGQPGATINRFWWDDWFALLSAFSIVTYFAIAFVLVELGFGLHIWMVEPTNLPKIFQFLYSIYYIYDLSLFLTKTSALLFLMRMFPKHANSAWWNYTLYATHGLNIAWFLGIVFGTVFMCNPVQKGWDPMRPGHCGTTSSLWMGSAIPSVAIDLVILLLPVPKIWSLQMGRPKKVGITIVFILGYCVIVVSLGRLVTVLKSAEALNQDITYEGMPMVYWVTAEPPTTLISICLPPMIILARKFYSNLLLPLSGKFSSLMSGGSTMKSQSKAYDLSHKSDDRKDMHLRLHSIESGQSFSEARPSLHSTESRNDLVGNAPTVDVPSSYVKGSEYSDTRPLQEQYKASIQSGGPERHGYRGNIPSRQIQVDQHISVDRQARRL